MTPSFAADVTLGGARWRALQPPEQADVVQPGPYAAFRDVRLSATPTGLRVEGTWILDAREPGWFEAPLASADLHVESLTWRGQPVGLGPVNHGLRTVVVWVDGPSTLRMEGTLDARVTEGEGPLLPLLGAGSGIVRVPTAWALAGEGLIRGDDDRWWGGAADLAVVGRIAATSTKRTLVRAQIAAGITVGDAAAQVEVRAVWTAAQGGMGEVAFTAPGAGNDLDVQGPQVASFTRSGDRVVVTLREADMPRAALSVTWSVAVPQGAEAQLSAPRLIPEGTFRSSFVTKLARDGDVEVLPAGGDWEPRAFADLPPWAQGLVQGTPTAALTSSRGDGMTLSLLRFEPVSGPATLIDVAQTAMAISDEGRVILRTHLAVRNDRGAFLTVTPPPGLRILGASVAGETAEPFREGRAWRIAMKKSVETVDGLLSFPVRLVMVGEIEAFDGRTRQSLPLPLFDAEVAAHRVTVNLPRGHRSIVPEGERHTVAAFSEGEGITYGFAVGDARASEADALFQQAVSSWMANDFDQAQSTLDQLQSMGAANQDVDKLQGNLDLLFKSDAPDTSASSRRVKEQAKARSIEETREQQQLLQEAEQALLEGDYAFAESNYSRALDIGSKLERLDASEDQSNAYNNAVVEQKLEEAKKLSKKVKEANELNDLEGARERSRREAEAAARAEEASRAAAETERRARAAAEASAREQEEAKRYAIAQAREKAMRQAQEALLAGPQDAPTTGDALRTESTPESLVIEDRKVETIDSSNATVLTKDFLQKIPAGRSYQSTVQTAAGVSGNRRGKGGRGGADGLDGVVDEPAPVVVGVEGGVPGGVVSGTLGGVVGGVFQGDSNKTAPPTPIQPSPRPRGGSNPNMAGGASNENTYTVDGANASDATRGTRRQGAAAPEPVFEEAPAEPSEAYRETTTIDFDEADISGMLVEPDGDEISFDDIEAMEQEEVAMDVPRQPSGGGGKPPRSQTPRAPSKLKPGKKAAADPVDRKAKESAPSGTKVDRSRDGNAAPRPPADTIDIAMGDSDALPDVKATTLDIIVPALGDTIRYQHLLVPAGAESTLFIETRPVRGRRKK